MRIGLGLGLGQMLGQAEYVAPYDPSPFGLDALTSKYAVFSPAQRVLSSYPGNGKLIRLRRGSDNAESDFRAVWDTGILDVAAVTAWLGGATGYVAKVYDQGPNGHHAVANSAAGQPPLDLSGSLPCMDFDGANHYLFVGGGVSGTAADFIRNQPQASLLAVCKYDSAAVTDAVMGVSRQNGAARMDIRKTSTVFQAQGRRLDADSGQATTGLTGNLNWVVQIGGFDWANSNLYHRVDAASETKTDFQTDGNTSDTASPYIYLGATAVTAFLDGKATLWVFTRDLLNSTVASDLVTSLAPLKVT